MSIFKKLVTAIRGHATEAGQEVVDANAITILEQEIRDTETELKKSDAALTTIMGKRKLQENKVTELKDQVAKYEGYAVNAMEKSDDTLAIECAEKVSEFEAKLATEQNLADTFLKNEKALKVNIRKAKQNTQMLKNQIDQVKATESVQKAQIAVNQNYNGANSKMKTAAESMERIQARQQQREAELDSADELAASENGSELEAKLAAAGIGDKGTASANDVLARLKAKKTEAAE